MDPEDYTWGIGASNQHNVVSSLDLLEEEVYREEANNNLSQWSQDQQLHIEGEPAVTFPREVTKTSPRKPSTASKAPVRRKSSIIRNVVRSVNNAEDHGSKKQLQFENENLQREVMKWRREVEHIREEKHELEAAFRRLDQEIGNGYHLAERKEKELRIAELVAKNQKMSQMLEKELHSHDDLRRAYVELQAENRKLKDQVELLNRVVDSVETKNATLVSTHATLTASYEAAQVTIETLQGEVLSLQEKLASSDTRTQLVADYEDKIRSWERSYRELEHKCELKAQKLVQTKQIASETQHAVEKAHQRQAALEQELSDAHDLVIRTNAAMRTMEAKVEANLKAAHYGVNQEALNRRVRHLEVELFEKTRVNADLVQTCNQLLGSQKRSTASRGPQSARNGQAMASRVSKLTTHIASLTDKLRFTEEARDRKSRSLDVLMQALPRLLQRLDGVQDRLAAVVESNDILTSAIEQMQDPQGIAHNWSSSGTHYDGQPAPHMTAAMYLNLARENYILESPYPVELLVEQTGAQVFSDCSGTASLATTKRKKFTPFRVTCSPMKMNNQTEVDSDDQTYQLVMLAADPNDTSGAAYLNRSKINAFLEVIQSRAARMKFKTLLIGKLAECLNKLREMAHRSATESAIQLASNQMLQREVAELRQKLRSSQIDSRSNGLESTNMAVKVSSDVAKTRDFLLKVVDVYAEKQQQDDYRQKTFLTQPLSSDMLTTYGQEDQNTRHSISDDRLCLTDCQLDDDDVSQLLLKVLVSDARFREILLDSNNLSDAGVQHIASFVEKAPPCVRVISLVGNKRITKRGLESIRRGILKNQRVQRFEEVEGESKSEFILRGLAIKEDFDVSGNATEIIRIILPTMVRDDEQQANLESTTTEAVDAMTEKLRQLGFTYNIRQPLASRPRSAIYSSKNRFPARNAVPRPRSASSVPSRSSTRYTSLSNTSRTNANSTTYQRQQIKKQQDIRFQSLEAALQRASTPRQIRNSLTQPAQQYRSRTSRSANTTTSGGRTSGNTYGNAHVNTVRGLRR